MSLRILFAIHGPGDPLTAVYANVRHRCASLQADGHTVDLLTADDLRVAWLSPRLDPLVLAWSLLRNRLRSYDAVVFHSYLGWAFHAVRGWSAPGRPVTVTMFHGLEPLYHRVVAAELARDGRRLSARFHLLHHVVLPRLLRFTASRSDAVFCLNRAEADYLAAERWVTPERLHVVANGFDAESAQVDRDYANGRRFLCIVQWLPAKGVRYLVEAFSTVARLHDDVELTCAGTGASADAVLDAFSPDVRTRVRVLPRLSRGAIHEELRRADVFVLPSLSEGFSLALLEALGSRLPVVCTPAGAAADILRPGLDALVVPVADGAALAASMERLAADGALRRQLGEAGAAVAARFTWSKVGQDYNEQLLRIVGAHAGR